MELFLQIICVRENNTYQLLQVLRQLKIFMTWRIKMFLLKKFELTKYHLLKRRTRTPVWQKKQFVMWENKKNDVRNTPPETIRNEKKLRSEKGTKLKKCRLRFYGAIRKAVQRRTPRSARLWVDLFIWVEVSLFWRVLDRGALLRACICQAPAKVPIVLFGIYISQNGI